MSNFKKLTAYEPCNVEYVSVVDKSYIDQLKAENAKLRELVTEIYPYAKACLQEWRILGCTDSKSYDWYLQLRELGIEVTE